MTVGGEELGLLIGPGGATLSALQEVTRTVVQRHTGGHSDRIIVDVAGYRAKRAEALAKFAPKVADEVITAGEERALEPMSPPDRKVVHDTVNEIEVVATRSEGEEPRRYVVISPTATAAAPAEAAEPATPAEDYSGRACVPGPAIHGRRQEPEPVVTPPTPPVSRPVLEALERSRALGFLGPGPLDLQVDHALGFGDTTEAHLPPGTAAGPILDLGSGGGLPGLVLAERWPDAALTLSTPTSVARRSCSTRSLPLGGETGWSSCASGPKRPGGWPRCGVRSASWSPAHSARRRSPPSVRHRSCG